MSLPVEQNLGLPSAVQEPSDHEGYFRETASSTPAVNGTGNDLISEDSIVNLDKFRFANLFGNVFTSPPLSTIPQITGNIGLFQQQQQQQVQQLYQFQQQQEQQALCHSQSINPSRLSLSPESSFALAQQQVDGLPWSVPQYTTTHHTQGLQPQNFQEALCLADQQFQQLPSQQQYCDPDILNKFQPYLASPSAFSNDSIAPLAPSLSTAATAATLQYCIPFPLSSDSLSDPNILQAVPIDFSQFRTPIPGQLTSPENSPSSIPEHGFFDQAESEVYSSPVIPSMHNPLSSMIFGSGNDYLHGPMAEITISGSHLFGTSSAPAGPVLSMTSDADMATVMPNHLVVAPIVQSTSALTLQPVGDPTDRLTHINNPQQSTSACLSGYQNYQGALSMPVLFASSSSNSAGRGHSAKLSTSSPHSSSTLAIPSSSKRQKYIGTFSDDDDSDFPIEDEENKNGPKRRRRVRKAPIKTVQKVKGPSITLNCRFQNCRVTCSSYPSLNRHELAHRWRGQFSPVRCEACQSSLSNEFSVQRHILRSAPTSRCRKMRIYSIMKAEDEIETTVKFFPTRGHGKKTVKVDLERMKAKYIQSGLMD
ncbi:hypothetical protein EC991_001665 [Linnemannia zychae]|nr:hypothetical protein EC991_001665 [Linnemannia zychae]